MRYDVLVLGGGAAGFFAAIHLLENDPGLSVAILEKGKQVLAKVKISGGGRCNLTHAEFDPARLAQHYPRGEKEMLGPFHNFGPAETMSFFEQRGIPLKIERDGRVFPVSDSSQTIVDCLTGECKKLGIKVLRHSAVTQFRQASAGADGPLWEVVTIKKRYTAPKVIVATGGNPAMWRLIQQLGHRIVPPIPSLFTFNIADDRINGIPGVATKTHIAVLARQKAPPKTSIPLKSRPAEKILMEREGPTLITHWGLSGPAVLCLSAWGARQLNAFDYRFRILVNWLPDYHKGAVVRYLMQIKDVEAKKTVSRTKGTELPQRLWANLVRGAAIAPTTKWADMTKTLIEALADQLHSCEFRVTGKSAFKEEFVTAGGVDLKEIDFKTFGSKLCPGLFFAGEVIDVDGITGGFNFQNAWTGAYLAAKAVAEK